MAGVVEIVLPGKGEGFSVKGPNWTGVLASREVSKTAEIKAPDAGHRGVHHSL